LYSPTQGDGALRLCPRLLCVGLSGRQNVQTPGARFIAPIHL